MMDADKFTNEFSELCKKHGVSAFALVVRGEEVGPSLRLFQPGLSGNTLEEKIREGEGLYFDMHGLAKNMLDMLWMPQVPEELSRKAAPIVMETLVQPIERVPVEPGRLDGPYSSAWPSESDPEEGVFKDHFKE